MAYDSTMDTATTSLKMSHTGPDEGLHFWLVVDGVPVSYAKIYERTTAHGTELTLCDIETREGHRNRGHARRLLELLAEGYGVAKVIHGGSYTPDGFSYISQLVERRGAPAVGPSCGPMNFVHDWDSFQPKYA